MLKRNRAVGAANHDTKAQASGVETAAVKAMGPKMNKDLCRPTVYPTSQPFFRSAAVGPGHIKIFWPGLVFGIMPSASSILHRHGLGDHLHHIEVLKESANALLPCDACVPEHAWLATRASRGSLPPNITA